VGDVLIGAAAQVAEYNGTDRASHIKDKLVEMTHLNETIYGTGIASSFQGRPTSSGAWICDDMLANVCKHHVTKLPHELGRLAQDLAGGLVGTMPSQRDLDHPQIGALLHKYLKGRADVPTETRLRIIRLIENMTLGRNAVGYLTESIHGAGSPQAQRVQIARGMQLEYRKRLARVLAGIDDIEDSDALADELTGYFAEVFRTGDALATTTASPAGGDPL
jgi:4-hydroxybutyryl-CoA dehydratase/vinylacetyl-CoA-Delta-isomerase